MSKNFSCLTETKMEILENGVFFEPYNLFTDFKGIEKYKTKKITKKTVSDGKVVYDYSQDKNVLPAEVVLTEGENSSIVKLRYSPNSNLKISLEGESFFIYKNGKKLPLELSLVEKLKTMESFTPFIVGGNKTRVCDYIDLVGLDRITVLFFDGCYNWISGKPCKFCDLHPREVDEVVIKPTCNCLHKFDFNIEKWWNNYKEDYIKGLIYSLKTLVKEEKLVHKHLFFMAGNLENCKQVWKIALEVVERLSKEIDLREFDSYINIAPHDEIESLKKMKELGVKQVQYNLEITDKELFEFTCPGKIGYDAFVEKLKEAVSVFGFGNVRSNFVFGLEDKEKMLTKLKEFASLGIVADYSVFQPKKGTPYQDKKAPTSEDIIDFTNKLADIYIEHNFKPIFCSLSSRSSLVNEIYRDKNN